MKIIAGVTQNLYNYIVTDLNGQRIVLISEIDTEYGYYIQWLRTDSTKQYYTMTKYLPFMIYYITNIYQIEYWICWYEDGIYGTTIGTS